MAELHTGSRSDRLDRTIHALLSQTPEIEAAAVVSFDGLPMAAALPPSMDEDRVAAMSAALLSLGERAAQGLGRGELSQVYIEGDNGTVFLISADNEAVLVAVAAKGAKVGMMLYEVKRAAAAVADVLRADVGPFEPALPVEPVLAVVPAPSQPAPSAAALPSRSAPQAEPALAYRYAGPQPAEPALAFQYTAPQQAEPGPAWPSYVVTTSVPPAVVDVPGWS